MKKQTKTDLPAPPDVIEFAVGETHIQAGQRWNVSSGPLAKALTEHLLGEKKEARDVQVGYLFAYINGYEYTLDDDTRAWVNAFLHKEPVQPFRAKLKKGAPAAASIFDTRGRAVYPRY